MVGDFIFEAMILRKNYIIGKLVSNARLYFEKESIGSSASPHLNESNCFRNNEIFELRGRRYQDGETEFARLFNTIHSAAQGSEYRSHEALFLVQYVFTA